MLGDGQLTGQFHGLGSGGSFADCGELVGGALDAHGGGPFFGDGRFNKFFGGAHGVLAFFTLG